MYRVTVLMEGVWITSQKTYKSRSEAQAACERAALAPDEYKIIKEEKHAEERT